MEKIEVRGGASNEEVTAAGIATETRVRELERENERELVALTKDNSEEGAAARRDYDVVMASALVIGTRLEALLRGKKIVERWKANPKALLAEKRRRQIDDQQRDLAARTAVEEERAAAHVREHPLGPTEIVKMVESRGAILRLGAGGIEVAPCGTLDTVTKKYITSSARAIGQVLEARTLFEVIARVPRNEESD